MSHNTRAGRHACSRRRRRGPVWNGARSHWLNSANGSVGSDKGILIRIRLETAQPSFVSRESRPLPQAQISIIAWNGSVRAPTMLCDHLPNNWWHSWWQIINNKSVHSKTQINCQQTLKLKFKSSTGDRFSSVCLCDGRTWKRGKFIIFWVFNCRWGLGAGWCHPAFILPYVIMLLKTLLPRHWCGRVSSPISRFQKTY